MTPDFELSIRVLIRQVDPYNSNNHLQLEETITVKAQGFFEMASILGQFHDLAKRIQVARSDESATNRD